MDHAGTLDSRPLGSHALKGIVEPTELVQCVLRD